MSEHVKDKNREGSPSQEGKAQDLPGAPGSQEAQGSQEPQKKRSRKRLGITLGVVAAVIVVAGIGMLVWHEQPSFCNAFCHYSMDGYIDTYEATPGEATTDIWGNAVADASGMMSATHASNDADATCLTCHEPSITEQVTEGITWLTGNYVVPLTERSITDLAEGSGMESGTAFCLRSGCHEDIELAEDGSFASSESFKALTEDYDFNPHGWTEREEHVTGLADLECSDCHKAHRASVLYCTQCHSGEATVPDGWISYGAQSDLEYFYADL